MRRVHSGPVRESEFQRLMTDEFGDAYARMVAATHHFGALGERTADQALAAGVPARRVWEAVCICSVKAERKAKGKRDGGEDTKAGLCGCRLFERQR